jgi:phosphatidylglycerophosphatase C
MKKLYLIDFDGTITSKDSFVEFTLFSIPFFSLIKFWITTFFLFFITSKSKLKERLYKKFQGENLDLFQSICDLFVEEKLIKTIRQSFLDFNQNLDCSNSKIVIVSASISNYLKPWCDKMGFHLISTELEVKDGKLTGKFSTPNCNGKEKVRRINEKYDLSIYNEIHVFGNSKGDFPMLELGTHKYYKFFK